MGAQLSQEKSSLLKNFTYLIDEESGARNPPTAKLMYFDYLKFLQYEIDNKAWKWYIYKNIVEQNGGGAGGILTDDEKLFCGWKEIQKEIFDKLNKQLIGKNSNTYDWTKDALPLIDIAFNNNFTGTQNCSNINVDLSKIEELKDSYLQEQQKSINKGVSCKLNTAPNLHIPLRRRALLVKYIYEYLNEIEDEFNDITDEKRLQTVLKSKSKNIKVGSTDKKFNLTKDVVEGIAKDISNLIKQKHGTDYKAFCKEWERTMDDYFKLLQGIDIVDDKETNDLQCLIKDIENKVTDSAKFKQAWSSYFRTIVHDLWKNEFTNKITGTSCNIDRSDKTQCVRFFEEWAEEFCELKKKLGELIIKECKTQSTISKQSSSTLGNNCTNVCNIYKKFMTKSEPYFTKYVSTCIDKRFGGGEDDTELKRRFSHAAINSMTECCTDFGNCSSTDLYDVTNDKSNIRYKCFCENGEYYSKQDSQAECKQILNPNDTVTGLSVSVQPSVRMPQTVASSGCSGISVYEIASRLQMKANRLVITHIGGLDDLKGKISNAQFKNNQNGNDLTTNICQLDEKKHTNDKRNYGAGANEHQGPCTGKGQERFNIGKDWEPRGDANPNDQEVLFPPRRLDMCTSNLEYLNVETFPLNDAAKVNDAFLGDVLLTAYKEAEFIKNNYSDPGDHPGVCRAVRASFADIADIIRGRDIWTKESGNAELQKHLVKIFQKIKENVRRTTTTYDDANGISKLREDWWEANRSQVWEAMKCHVGDYNAFSVFDSQYKSGNIIVAPNCGYGDSVTPLDDYIPQKLRWLTEWSEWFCKAQYSDYDSVKSVCDICKNNVSCTKGGKKCTLCSGLCNAYKDTVEKWKDNWEKQKRQYNKLYQATDSNEFLEKLKSEGKCEYKNAAGYVHDIGNFDYCKKGRLYENQPYKFYDTTGKSIDDNYAFRSHPKDYVNECKCNDEDESTKKIPKGAPGKVDGASGPTTPVVVIPNSPVVDGSSTSSSSEKTCNGKIVEIKELKNGNDYLKICDDNKEHSLDGTLYRQGIYFVGKRGGSKSKTPEGVQLSKISDIYSYLRKSRKPPCRDHILNGKVWKCDKDNKSTDYQPTDDKVCLPPRTQLLCVGNLNVDPDTTTHTKGNSLNIDDVDDEQKLLTEVLIAAKYEGGNLKNNYNKMNENSQYFCSKIKYSFGDLADIIKGKNIYDLPTSDKTENNLVKIFKKIYDKLGSHQSKYNDSGISGEQKYKKLREAWWNTNRKYVWKILVDSAAPTDPPKCLEQFKNTPPDIDGTPQLLRFTQEWGDEFCVERKTRADAVVTKCQKCKEASEKYHEKNSIGSGTHLGAPSKDCENNGSTSECTECKEKCKECKEACQNYRKFVEGKADNHDGDKPWRQRWKQMEEKYNKLIDDAKERLENELEKQRQRQRQPKPQGSQSSIDNIPPYMMKCEDKDRKNEVCLKPDVDSFFQYLYDKGHTTLSSYMNSVSENVDCGKDEPKWGTTTSGGSSTTDMYPQPFGGKTVGYKYACECKIPSRDELCEDNQLYRNRWDCSTSGSSTPASNYELCRDKTTTTTTTKSHQPHVLGTKLSKEDVEFFNLFDLWYKDIQNRLDHNIRGIKEQCDKDKIMAQTSASSSGTRSALCLGCRDSCECYTLWVNHMRNQWDKQQKNFNTFEKSSGSQEVTLNHFLFASCWEDYLQKSNRGTDIDSLDAGTHGDTIDVLIDRCGKDKKEAQTKFDERIKKADKEKNMCDKNQKRCQSVGDKLECTGYSDVVNCEQKQYDDTGSNKKKDWKCTQGTGEKLEKDVCVSPRTQSLCVANMYGNFGGKSQLLITDNDKDIWKIEIQKAMKKETENLYNYYNSKDHKKRAIISSGQTDSNGMPKNFCKAAERTYNDFKHMVIGDVQWKPESFGAIDNKIDDIITKNAGISRQDWWEQNSDKFWEAIKCGIQAKHDGSAAGDECGLQHPDDTDNQFVWWFKEWGQQFCIERKTYIDEINEKCDPSASSRCENVSGTKKLKSECKNKCEKYKQFIKDKNDAWNKQKSKYEREKPGMKAQELLGQHYPECLEANFDNIFGNISGSNGNEYGDASDICSCEQQIYNCNASSSSTCKSKSGDLTTWRTGLLKIGKYNKKLEGVYVPPRRQKLCLANLYPINFGKPTGDVGIDISRNKNTLLNRLQIIAEREAYYLWLQHVTKDKKDDLSLHKKACCAIRNSFYDIGDIVKGTDLWDDQSKKYIDKTLSDLFKQELEKTKKNHQINPEQIRQARKQWWEYTNATDMGSNKDNKTIRDGVWDAMQCGVKNAMQQLNGGGRTVSDYELPQCIQDKNNRRNFDSIPTPQFARWLVEWTHQFCEEYAKHMDELQLKCVNSGSGNNNDCGGSDECKNACTAYNNWISLKRKEWVGMSKYYSSIYRMNQYESPDSVDYTSFSQPTAMDHLNQECKNNINGTNNCCYCENVGTNSTSTVSNPLEHMEKIMNKIDYKYKQYKSLCTNCQLKHIKDQIEKIEKKIQERKAKKNADIGSNVKPAHAKPIATKPEVPRPQAAKPAAAKPATTKVVEPKTSQTTQHSSSPGRSGPNTTGSSKKPDQGSKDTKGGQSPSSTNNCNGVDQVDKGLCCGGSITSYSAPGSSGSITVTPAQTPTPDPKSVDTNPTPGHSPAPASSSSGSSVVVGGSDDPSGKGTAPSNQGPVNGKGPGETTPKARGLDELLKQIKDAVSTTATLAGVLGAVGTTKAIEVANAVMPIAQLAGILGAIDAADKIPKAINVVKGAASDVLDKLSGANSNSGGKVTNSGQPSSIQGTNTAPNSLKPVLDPNPSYPGSAGGTGNSGNTIQGPSLPGGGPPHGTQVVPGQGSSGELKPGSSLPSPKTPTITPTTVFSSSIPLAVGMAFGALCYLWLKKKPKSSPVDLLRVIDIPQNDYGIPDKTSTNRYVPYGKYKGKTYIYIEGDEPDDYSYVRDISSSDITSSESEYEEMDINDIYPYKSPKYKTLIEVVLVPSNKTYDVQDTHDIHYTNDTSMYQKDDSNKFTYEEWSQLKHEFILQYLKDLPSGMDHQLPNENNIDDNMYKDTQPDVNILHVNKEEKPFITKIQDKDLHNGGIEVTYNIDWNVPENINRTTNTTDVPKYISSNDQYSGIDLINDSLNRDQHVDIYDELLKRKENELFGTNHTKHTTSTYSVAKQTYSDPISNKIDLFHK